MVFSSQLGALKRKIYFFQNLRLNFGLSLVDNDVQPAGVVTIFDLIIGVNENPKNNGVSFSAALSIVNECNFE